MIAAAMKESKRVDGSESGCGAAALANSHRTGKPTKNQNLPPKNHNFRSRELDHPETNLVSSTVRALRDANAEILEGTCDAPKRNVCFDVNRHRLRAPH